MVPETPRATSIVLELPGWPGHRAGQLRAGDRLELRGPIGDFVWDDIARQPTLLIADGWGIVAFRSMLRHRQTGPGDAPVRLLYSARSLQDVIYRDELMRLAAYDEVDIRLALTREWPPIWHGHRGQVDARLLSRVCWPAGDRPGMVISGPTAFARTVASVLVAQGQDSDRIRLLGVPGRRGLG